MAKESALKLAMKCHQKNGCHAKSICPFVNTPCEQITESHWDSLISFMNTSFAKEYQTPNPVCANQHICKHFKE